MHARPTTQIVETQLTLHELIQLHFQVAPEDIISYKNLIDQLNQFLLPHGIHTECCDIFEETLLKAAGITTQPTQCFFKSITPDMVEFEFQGITKDDFLKFCSYCDKLGADRFYTRISFNEITNTGKKAVALSVVYNKLLPIFKAAFSNIPQEKLDHYSDLSKDNADVIDYSILQSILVLLDTTLKLMDDRFKAGMLTVLNDQLRKAIYEYRAHQLHACPQSEPSLEALDDELSNFLSQSRAFPVLGEDSNIQTVNALIHQYGILHFFKAIKKAMPMNNLFVKTHEANIPVSSASDVSSDSSSTYSVSYDELPSASASPSDSSLSSSTASETASQRSDSPLRSVARLFATPPGTSTHSRSASTASVQRSDTPTEVISLFDDTGSWDTDSDIDLQDTPFEIPLSPTLRRA
jgi:hypothetical protein